MLNYNPNNIIIGCVLLFLIGYAFFIIRRMYKRRISTLEEKIVEMERFINNGANIQSDTNIDTSINSSDPILGSEINNENIISELNARLNPLNGIHISTINLEDIYTNKQNKNFVFDTSNEVEELEVKTNESKNEVAEESQEVVEESQEVVEESQEVVEESQEVVEETQEVVEETQEVVEETQESAEETQESAEESQEVVEETQEAAEESNDIDVSMDSSILDIKKNDESNSNTIEKSYSISDIECMNVADLRKNLESLGVRAKKGMRKEQLKASLIANTLSL